MYLRDRMKIASFRQSIVAGGATIAPGATGAQGATVAPRADSKSDDDHIKNHHHQKAGRNPKAETEPETTAARLRREREETQEENLNAVRDVYEGLTGNQWCLQDTEAWKESGLDQEPSEKVIPVMEAVVRRTPPRVNSFRYFIREILASRNPANRAWRKKQLLKIARSVRDNAVGRTGYSAGDFLEDVKCACARQGVQFDNDLFDELAG
jgi:hypothetical protein